MKYYFRSKKDVNVKNYQGVRDRYYACVASDDLAPPEGQECEKKYKDFVKSEWSICKINHIIFIM